MIDLLATQIFMNQLLQNHSTELHHRISHCNHEISSLQQQLEEASHEKEDDEVLKCHINRLQRREPRIRKIISTVVNIKDDQPTLEIIRNLLEFLIAKTKEIEKMNEATGTLKKVENEFQRLSEENTNLQDLNKNLENHISPPFLLTIIFFSIAYFQNPFIININFYQH
jgi:DNA repair exonuclease SbcCD ATPase subunit